MTKYKNFGQFKYIFTSKNLVLNTFSGSINLWRLFGEYEHLGASMLVYGVFEWVRGPDRMVEITKYMTFGHFNGISTSKN